MKKVYSLTSFSDFVLASSCPCQHPSQSILAQNPRAANGPSSQSVQLHLPSQAQRSKRFLTSVHRSSSIAQQPPLRYHSDYTRWISQMRCTSLAPPTSSAPFSLKALLIIVHSRLVNLGTGGVMVFGGIAQFFPIGL